MTEPWTRARLLDLVAGRQVVLLKGDTSAVPPPDWIFASGATAADVSNGQRVAITHPDDRPRLIEAWWEAVNNPGEVIEIDVRAKLDGAWVMTHTRKVCLLDDPLINAMVDAIEFGRTVDADEFDEVIQSGEYEDTRLLIHTLDETGVITATEGMVEEIVGRSIDEVIGQSVIEHLHPDGFDDALIQWMELMAGPPGTTRTGRTRVLRPDGSVIWVETTTIKRVDADGRVWATALVHDATERRRQEAALRTSQHEFKLLADQVPAAVFRADAQQGITFRNARWRQEIDGDDPVERLVDLVHPDDRAYHDGQLDRLATGRQDASAAYEVRGRDGHRVFAITSRSVLDLVNETRSYVGSVTDITATVRLRERAERDALTGLWNRQATEEHLDRALTDDPFGTRVVFVDLDGFKAINDTWGHPTGDAVLRAVAERMQASMRPGDIVGRFGGDEFIVVVRGADDRTDASVVERLRDALAAPVTWPGGSWSPAASIGVARGAVGDDVAALMARADLEMFTEKRQHKALS